MKKTLLLAVMLLGVARCASATPLSEVCEAVKIECGYNIEDTSVANTINYSARKSLVEKLGAGLASPITWESYISSPKQDEALAVAMIRNKHLFAKAK